MDAEGRRRAIAAELARAGAPVSAAALAARLGVSRQVIVGDVALLRASGMEITATPRSAAKRANRDAHPRPYGVALRAPTTATPSESAATLPTTYRRAGGSASASNAAG